MGGGEAPAGRGYPGRKTVSSCASPVVDCNCVCGFGVYGDRRSAGGRAPASRKLCKAGRLCVCVSLQQLRDWLVVSPKPALSVTACPQRQRLIIGDAWGDVFRSKEVGLVRSGLLGFSGDGRKGGARGGYGGDEHGGYERCTTDDTKSATSLTTGAHLWRVHPFRPFGLSPASQGRRPKTPRRPCRSCTST